MSSSSAHRPRRRRAVLAALALSGLLAATACSGSTGGAAADTTSAAASSDATTATATGDGTDGAPTTATTDTVAGSQASGTAAAADGDDGTGTDAAAFLSSDEVHEIALTFDEAAYAEMLATYAETGDKTWIEVTVTIDGTTYERAGARLKGNSSLRGLATGSTAETTPESLPWLIRLDEYVDGQDHDGMTELVVRANSTESSLNEAVALDLLRAAGLASQQAALVRLTVNGSDADLRLVIEHPNDEWLATAFEDEGILYKAESEGDYSYRGTDPAAYEDVFDQETGDTDDLTPLIEFLDFVNNSDDATFAAELADHLDVAAFARYLAFEELIDNFDDIDGPGNNSYLYWDAETDGFTVVAWDHNLAFGSRPGGAGGQMPGGGQLPGAGGGQLPGGGGRMPGGEPPAGAAGGMGGARGPMGGSNVLVTRFQAVDEFAALVTQAKADLTAELYTDGTATESVERWAALIRSDAADLVSEATLTSEIAGITKYVTT